MQGEAEAEAARAADPGGEAWVGPFRAECGFVSEANKTREPTCRERERWIILNQNTFRLAREADGQSIVSFVRAHWETRHPLVELPDFFDYYYRPGDGSLRFALAESDGALCALAGFVAASRAAGPDIWVSLWAADKAARGAGLELMAALPGLTGCRTLACNNIRPETQPFYTFLGYTAGRVGHYYRLNPGVPRRIAAAPDAPMPPVAGTMRLALLPTAAALRASGFAPPQNANPYKDLWYIQRRYYEYPRQQYSVYGVVPPEGGMPQALVATRLVRTAGSAALRWVDYVGPPALLPQCGAALNALMCEAGAEYTDVYCAGFSDALMHSAGFLPRAQDGEVIIPNYLTPLDRRNVEYYYFTNNPSGFALFRADGDQDRPYVPLDEG